MAPVRVPVCSVTPGVSARFIGLMGFVHGAAALVPWLLGLPPALAALVGAAVLAWGGWQIGVHAGRLGRTRVTGLELMADGRAQVRMQDGGDPDATLEDVPLTNRMVTLLVFRTRGGQRLIVTVWADAFPPDQYRHLRVYVRWAEWRRGGTRNSGRSSSPP